MNFINVVFVKVTLASLIKLIIARKDWNGHHQWFRKREICNHSNTVYIKLCRNMDVEFFCPPKRQKFGKHLKWSGFLKVFKVYLFIYLFIWLFVFMHSFIHSFVCLFVYLFVYLIVWFFWDSGCFASGHKKAPKQ